MEQRVKVGDRIKIIKPWMTQGRYEKGDVLTVRSVGCAGAWVVENAWYIDRSEFEIITDEIITDEIKPCDTVTLIDKPWEWDGWAKLTRKLRLIYKGFMGKEHEVIRIIDSPNVTDLRGRVCADIGRYYIVPLAILRKVEPVKLWKSLAPLEAKHRYTDEQINEAKMIIGRLVADLEQATDLAFIEDGNLTKLYIDGRKVSEAKCSPQDEPNRAIGRMVAMLKRFDDPLPTWIRE